MARKKSMQLWTLNQNSTDGTHLTLAASGTWPVLLKRMQVNASIFASNYFVKYPDGSLKPLMA